MVNNDQTRVRLACVQPLLPGASFGKRGTTHEIIVVLATENVIIIQNGDAQEIKERK